MSYSRFRRQTGLMALLYFGNMSQIPATAQVTVEFPQASISLGIGGLSLEDERRRTGFDLDEGRYEEIYRGADLIMRFIESQPYVQDGRTYYGGGGIHILPSDKSIIAEIIYTGDIAHSHAYSSCRTGLQKPVDKVDIQKFTSFERIVICVQTSAGRLAVVEFRKSDRPSERTGNWKFRTALFPGVLGGKPVARVKLPGGADRGRTDATASSIDICDSARRARERNSPATAGLEAQCAAYTARVQPVRTEQEIADMAARGAAIGVDDPAIMSMRERFGSGADARAFDVGLAVAERQTEWGPGKQRLALSFDPGPRNAYMAAAEYTVDRNRNAARVAIGSQISQADPELAEIRTKNADPRFWLGFDIATAIFGDPSLGAQGNTALGPGSLGVRAALSELGKQGFDKAIKLHLSRTYGE